MEDWISRETRPEDRAALENMISVCFGDTPEMAAAFWDEFLTSGSLGLTAEKDRKVVGGTFLLKGIKLLAGPSRIYTCGYLFALGVLPEARSLGIGMTIHRQMCDLSLREVDCVSAYPATEALARKYQPITPFAPLGRVREAVFPGPLPADPSAPSAVRLTPEAYEARRESFLRDRPHAVFPPSFYRLLNRYGAVFLVLGNALAAAEVVENVCYVHELLSPEPEIHPLLSGIAAVCPAASYVVHTPLFQPGPGAEKVFLRMLVQCVERVSVPDSFWYPFTLS